MNLFEVVRDARGGITPELVIWALFIGFSVALVMALFSKRYMGNFVHKLLDEKIDHPDKAKTLAELGYGKNSFVKRALIGKTAYSGLIFEKDEEVVFEGDSVRPSVRRKVNFETAKFYIPKLLFPRAEIRYEKHGTHIMALIVGVVVFFALCMIAIYNLPTIEGWISEIF